MLLSNLRQRLHRVFATRAGRVVLTLLIGTLLASSLPDLQWHSHHDGDVEHLHPVHAAALESIDHHDEGNAAGSGNFHLHDGNHCSAAPMTFDSPGVAQLHRVRVLRANAAAPTSAKSIPPYRPPIV
jgi:hypothetical protein